MNDQMNRNWLKGPTEHFVRSQVQQSYECQTIIT